MKLIVFLSLLVSVALAQKTYPLDFDYTTIKSIWEAPQHTAVRPAPKNTSGGRIVGGEFAYAGQFPHHTLLIMDGSYWCGGSFLYENWVITVRNYLV